MTIQESTKKYESWVGKHIPLLKDDLAEKHARMGHSVFEFLRATFYRWAEAWPQVCADLDAAPQVLGIGDLHVENFGTWRDAEGRLVWGVNDFDEACWLAYPNDLVRLAVSARLALEDEPDVRGAAKLAVGSGQGAAMRMVCEALLDGYREGLERGGRPFVLAEHHESLRELAQERLKDPDGFWRSLAESPVLKKGKAEVPRAAWKLLVRAMPFASAAGVELRVLRRQAGLGGRGRRRFVAMAEWQGGWIAREVKECAPSAWVWARPEGLRKRDRERVLIDQIRAKAVRCGDPYLRFRDNWLVRRLAPDSCRIEIDDLRRVKDFRKLLRSMGYETANIHLGSAAAGEILKDLARRSGSEKSGGKGPGKAGGQAAQGAHTASKVKNSQPIRVEAGAPGSADWLVTAALAMEASLQGDFEQWRPKGSAKR